MSITMELTNLLDKLLKVEKTLPFDREGFFKNFIGDKNNPGTLESLKENIALQTGRELAGADDIYPILRTEIAKTINAKHVSALYSIYAQHFSASAKPDEYGRDTAFAVFRDELLGGYAKRLFLKLLNGSISIDDPNLMTQFLNNYKLMPVRWDRYEDVSALASGIGICSAIDAVYLPDRRNELNLALEKSLEQIKRNPTHVPELIKAIALAKVLKTDEDDDDLDYQLIKHYKNMPVFQARQFLLNVANNEIKIDNPEFMSRFLKQYDAIPIEWTQFEQLSAIANGMSLALAEIYLPRQEYDLVSELDRLMVYISRHNDNLQDLLKALALAITLKNTEAQKIISQQLNSILKGCERNFNKALNEANAKLGKLATPKAKKNKCKQIEAQLLEHDVIFLQKRRTHILTYTHGHQVHFFTTSLVKNQDKYSRFAKQIYNNLAEADKTLRTSIDLLDKRFANYNQDYLRHKEQDAKLARSSEQLREARRSGIMEAQAEAIKAYQTNLANVKDDQIAHIYSSYYAAKEALSKLQTEVAEQMRTQNPIAIENLCSTLTHCDFAIEAAEQAVTNQANFKAKKQETTKATDNVLAKIYYEGTAKVKQLFDNINSLFQRAEPPATKPPMPSVFKKQLKVISTVKAGLFKIRENIKELKI